MHSWISAVAIGALLVIATVWDLRRGEIPGLLTLGGLAAGLAASVIGGSGLATSLIGASVGIGLLIGLVLLGGMGIGDAWLMAAIGAWTSWHFVLAATLWASLAGGLLAIVALATCPTGLDWRQRIYPYVPAIAVGTTIAWFLQGIA